MCCQKSECFITLFQQSVRYLLIDGSCPIFKSSRSSHIVFADVNKFTQFVNLFFKNERKSNLHFHVRVAKLNKSRTISTICDFQTVIFPIESIKSPCQFKAWPKGCQEGTLTERVRYIFELCVVQLSCIYHCLLSFAFFEQRVPGERRCFV